VLPASLNNTMLKFIIYIFTLLSCSTFAFGQTPTNDSILLDKNKLQTVNKLIPDTLKIQTIEASPVENNWVKEKNMPWIAALIISILTVLTNILIAKSNLKSAKNNLEQQIQSSTVIANNQIDSNREATLRQFRATLNTNNRQAWVTDVRNVISELLTQAKLLNIEFQETNIDLEKKKILHEKVTYNHVKLLLLLDPSKEHHKPTLQSLVGFMNILDKHLLNSEARQQGLIIKSNNLEFMTSQQKFIDESRKLLYVEWGKIQTLI
jgi:hypothetical protein